MDSQVNTQTCIHIRTYMGVLPTIVKIKTKQSIQLVVCLLVSLHSIQKLGFQQYGICGWVCRGNGERKKMKKICSFICIYENIKPEPEHTQKLFISASAFFSNMELGTVHYCVFSVFF